MYHYSDHLKAKIVDIRCNSLYIDYCDYGDIRLVGRETEARGILEMCVYSEWGTVCGDDQWTNDAASIVCRQLGFSPYSESLHKPLTSINSLMNVTHYFRFKVCFI